ncbi:MAG TPA: glycosyltransferase family 4 protein, partial [Firmicutes bacterium]|nr:glycosyltransferase family 4 protein [Bacillota bacterium]
VEKHILILTTTKDFLGKFERENVRLLQEMGYTVHYATNRCEPAYLPGETAAESLGVPVHHIEIARSPFLLRDNEKALRQLIRLIRRYPIRAVHCHTPVGGLLGRLAGRLCPEVRPVMIYTAHGFHFYKGAPLFNHLAYYPVEKWLARYTDILIVINREDYRAARRLSLRKGGLVFQIPGVGLDRERFRPLTPEERARCRERLGIAPGQFFLVSVGELNENKNQKVILDALARMKAADPSFPALRYGVCGDGFFRPRMEEWIRELGLEGAVTLYGHRRDVPAVLGCADAAAFPSVREGLGMAGLEALAMGVPVLAADNRGTREYMAPGKNGFVCPPHDVDGFIRGIEAVRRMDEAQRRETAAFCRESTEPFDRRHTRAAMKEIYAAADRKVQARLRAEARRAAGGLPPLRLRPGKGGESRG